VLCLGKGKNRASPGKSLYLPRMLISPYQQSIELRRVSLVCQIILVCTIVIGSNAPLEYFMRQQPSLIPLNSVFWFGLYLAAALGLIASNGINWLTWLVRYRMLLITLIVGAILLTPWSVDPILSLNRLTHLVGTTLVAVYIAFSLPMARTLNLLAVTLFFLLATSLLAGQMLPSYAWEDHQNTLALKGLFDNKNSLGFWAGITLLLFPWCALQQRDVLSRVFWICATLMATIVLAQSRSAGSIIAITVAITLVSYITASTRFKLGFFAMSLVGVLLIAMLLIVFNGLNVAEVSGRSGDLTGRTEVWSQTWQLVQQRPLAGYGYGTLWFPTETTKWIQERYTDFTWLVYHAHNGVLHLASELGLPMAALALLFVVQQMVELVFCQLRQKHVGALVALGFSTAFLISNYSEARFMQSRELYWLFFIALPICLLRQIEVREDKPQQQNYPDPLSNQTRYPDEYIPNPNSKLGRLLAAKKDRRLRRSVVQRLAAPRGSD